MAKRKKKARKKRQKQELRLTVMPCDGPPLTHEERVRLAERFADTVGRIIAAQILEEHGYKEEARRIRTEDVS